MPSRPISLIAIFTLLAGFAPLVSGQAATNAAGLSQLKNPRGLDEPVYRWNALAVSVSGKSAPDDFEEHDYATAAYGRPWDFSQGTTDGINFHTNLMDFKVENGNLTFTTGENGWFYWGSYVQNDGFKKEKIGFNWLAPEIIGNWRVEMRVRQSVTGATWRVSALSDGVRPTVISRSVAVKGTNWQTVAVLMESYKRNTYEYPEFRRGLAVEPGTEPGNRVEIDWVKLVCPTLKSYFRGTFTLDKPVESAEACLTVIGTPCELYLNGEQVAGAAGVDQAAGRHRLAQADLSRFVRQGTNMIALMQRDGEQSLVALEGIVKFKDGTFQRIFTDATWKGGRRPGPDWMTPAFDDSGWKRVRPGPNVAMSSMCVHKDNTRAMGSLVNPPYFGPIELAAVPSGVSGDPHIFKLDDGITLTAKVIAREGAVYAARYALRDALNGGLVATGELAGVKNGARVEFPFSARPSNPGVYDLALDVMENGLLLDRRIHEIALVGKIPQPAYPPDEVERHVKKVLLDTIVCGDPEDRHEKLEGRLYRSATNGPFIQGGWSVNRLVAGSNPHLELGKERNDWISYKFAVKHPGKPCEIVVRYLDDRPCVLGVALSEPARKIYINMGELNSGRGGIGVAMGGPFRPLTGKPQAVTTIFFPRYDVATVTLFNGHAGMLPPAVLDISIYELEEMPAVAVPHESGRLFGDHMERGTLPVVTFHTGPQGDAFAYSHAGTKLDYHHGFYRDWYTVYANQIQYLRFSGQNMTIVGFLMYFDTYYPSTLLPSRSCTPRADQFALGLEMFGANDLYMIAGYEIFGCMSRAEMRQACQYTDEEVAAGAPSELQVNKDGRQVYGGGCGDFAIRPVPSNPAYQAKLKQAFAELMQRYGRYKGFAGVAMLSGFFSPTYFYDYANANLESALDVSYDDSTMAAFEKYLGKKIPVDAKDPERFSGRYEWVMQNAREQFITFRCREIARVHKAIADEIGGKYPGKQYYLLFSPCVAQAIIAEWKKGTSVEAIYRLLSFDPALYADRPDISAGLMTETDTFVNGQGAYQEMQASDEFNRFCGGERSAVFVRNAFNEYRMKYDEKHAWYWGYFQFLLPGIPFYEAHRYFARYYTARLLQNTPVLITHLWQDMYLNLGEQDQLCRFAVPFRSIPLGQYRNLTGNGLDRNMAIRETHDSGRHAFYVVNPYWWTVDVKLNLADKTDVRDLVTDAVTTTAALAFKLGPYQVKVFDLPQEPAGKEIALASAETTVDEEGRAFVKERLDLMQAFVVEATPALMQRMRLKFTVEQFKALITEAEQKFKDGDMSGALRRMDGYEALRVKDYIETKKNEGTAQVRPDYRVNLGYDREYKDQAGNVWLADQDGRFGARAYGFIGAEGGIVERDLTSTRGKIENTRDPLIYATERYNFEFYGFKVPRGVYTLKLHYIECYRLRAGYLEPGVLVNGKLRVEPFDLGAESGGFARPLVKTVKDIAVEDGELVLSFSTGKTGTRLSAIEVIQQ